MVVGVLSGQDRGSGGTAERIGDEGVVEGQALVGHVRFERRYLRDRCGVQVVGEYEDHVGPTRWFFAPPLYLSLWQEKPERQACPEQKQDPAHPAHGEGHQTPSYQSRSASKSSRIKSPPASSLKTRRSSSVK